VLLKNVPTTKISQVKPVAGDLRASLQPPDARIPGGIEGKSVKERSAERLVESFEL